MDRRIFIKTSAAVAGAAAAAGSGVALADAMPGRIGVVLYDPRFADSRAFAEALAARGAVMVSTEEDIGRLWNGPLAEAFAGTKGALAGMTPHTDLFISQVFAGQVARGRLTFEAMHDSRGSAVLTHTVDGPAGVAGFAREIADAGPTWPTLLAGKLAGQALGAKGLKETAVGGIAAGDHPGTLFTWVIEKA